MAAIEIQNTSLTADPHCQCSLPGFFMATITIKKELEGRCS